MPNVTLVGQDQSKPMAKPPLGTIFLPEKEKEIKRKRKYAEALAKQLEEKPTEMVSGIAIKQSPFEHLSRAIQGGIGRYQEGQLDKQEAEIEQTRQQRIADAIKMMEKNAGGSAELLMADPATSELGMKIMMDDLNYRRDLAKEGREFERQKTLKGLDFDSTDQIEQARFARQIQLQDLQSKADMAKQQNNFELQKQILDYKAQLEKQPISAGKTRKLSATEQKELFEAKEKMAAGQGAVGALKMAQDIYNRPEDAPDRPYTGFGADVMPALSRIPLVGDMIADKDRAAATTSAENLVSQQALESMKAIFGGNPTEGERGILLKLQALPTYTPQEQKQIIQMAIDAANRRVAFQQQMEGQILTGDYSQQMPMQNFEMPNQSIGLDDNKKARLEELRAKKARGELGQ